MSAFFNEIVEIRERCKGVHCVDLGESFPTIIYLQHLASIQPRTSPIKFARSPRTDPPGYVIAFLCCYANLFVDYVNSILFAPDASGALADIFGPSKDLMTYLELAERYLRPRGGG